MKRCIFPLVMVCLILCIMLSLARAENITYRGWNGKAAVINGRFAGCHLDSPPPTQDFPGEPIRVVADSNTRFSIEFVTYSWALLKDPQLKEGETFQVGLGTMKGDDYRQVEYGREDFQARLLGRGTNQDSKPFSRVMIAVNADDPLVPHLKGAQNLKVMLARPGDSIIDQSLGFDIINLRHHSWTNPKTWVGILDSNDTYGAIQEVLSCVARYVR